MGDVQARNWKRPVIILAEIIKGSYVRYSAAKLFTNVRARIVCKIARIQKRRIFT